MTEAQSREAFEKWWMEEVVRAACIVAVEALGDDICGLSCFIHNWTEVPNEKG